MRIAFLGTGRIARRLVAALAGAGHNHQLAVSRRSRATSAELAGRFPDITVEDDNQALVDNADIVFLCLDAAVARACLPGLSFRSEHSVVSVINGLGHGELVELVAPATDICITIPMPFVEHGGCPLPVFPGSSTLAPLLGERNPIVPVESEEALAPYWAVAGTLASVLSELATFAQWLGDRTGDAEQAERYVVSLYGGYLQTLATDGRGRLDEALADLATPGGFNAQILEAVGAAGHYQELPRLLARTEQQLR